MDGLTRRGYSFDDDIGERDNVIMEFRFCTNYSKAKKHKVDMKY